MKTYLSAIALSFMIFAQSGIAKENIYSFTLGDLRISAIKDRDTNMGRSILSDPNSAIAKKLLADDQNPSSINAFLIESSNAGEDAALIDTGFGEGLFEGLKTLNVQPEKIKAVLITHMHRDHIGGLTKDGAALFANAVVYVPKNDLAYWQGSSKENAADARELKAAYKDRLKTYEWGQKTDINYANARIDAIRADGHTPGHSVLEISSRGRRLLIIADLVHVLKVQFADPRQSARFDIDADLAAAARIRILNYASNAGIAIAGMHLPFPGIGVVKKNGAGFSFSPIKQK